jgi:hypothetical protein
LLVETSNCQWKFAFMAESFGGEFTIVVTLDDGSPTQMWVALAKPNQAMTLVLAAVPEGSTAEIFPANLTEKQRGLFEQLKLKPGDVYRLTTE